MDGVLADFDRGVRELCGLNPVDQSKSTNAQTDRLWEEVRKVPHFYGKLQPIESASEMFMRIFEKYGEACQILTGIPKPRRKIENAGEDKIEWAHKFLSPDVKVNIVFREQKPEFCRGAQDILVDDYDRNINEWKSHGGTGILFFNTKQTSDELRRILG